MRRMRYLALLLFLFCVPMWATQLHGTLKGPDGKPFNGSLTLTLSKQVRISVTTACGGPILVPPNYSVFIQIQNGTANWPDIYGSDCMMTPASAYTATLRDSQGTLLFTSLWNIAGTDLDVGTLYLATPITTPTTNYALIVYGRGAPESPCPAQTIYVQTDADPIGNNTWQCVNNTYVKQTLTSTVIQQIPADITPNSVAKIIYVYPTSGSDFGDLVNAAFTSVSCSIPTVVSLAPGYTTVSYTSTIYFPSCPNRTLEGNGITLQYTGSGDGIVVQARNDNAPTGSIRHLLINAPNTSGNVIHQLPRIFFSYEDVSVVNSTNATAFLMDNTSVSNTSSNGWPSGQGYSERTHFRVSSINNKHGILFQQNGGTNSFARTRVDVYCTILTGQSCVTVTSNAFVYGTSWYVNGNAGGDATTRFVEVLNGATVRAYGYMEGEGGGYGYYVDGSSYLGLFGAQGFDTSQGNYAAPPSSRVAITMTDTCKQAGYYNLGVIQTRNSKFCTNPNSIDDYLSHPYGAETGGRVNIWTRDTSDASPEADGANTRMVWTADGRGFIGIGPGYEPGGAYDNHPSGAAFETAQRIGQVAPYGINGIAWHTMYFDATNFQWIDYYRGGSANGQPNYPHCSRYQDTGGAGDITGECETVVPYVGNTPGYTNMTIKGSYTAASYNTTNALGWSGSCASPKAVVVVGGIVTGCQ